MAQRRWQGRRGDRQTRVSRIFPAPPETKHRNQADAGSTGLCTPAVTSLCGDVRDDTQKKEEWSFLRGVVIKYVVHAGNPRSAPLSPPQR